MSEEPTKFRYICLVRLLPAFYKLTTEERRKWFARHNELLKKYGLTMLFFGSAFGVPEQAAFVYESDKFLDTFNNFMVELINMGTPEARKYIEFTRTITVV